MDSLSGEETLTDMYLSILSILKEKVNPFFQKFGVEESKQEVTEFVSIVKMTKKTLMSVVSSL